MTAVTAADDNRVTTTTSLVAWICGGGLTAFAGFMVEARWQFCYNTWGARWRCMGGVFMAALSWLHRCHGRRRWDWLWWWFPARVWILSTSNHHTISFAPIMLSSMEYQLIIIRLPSNASQMNRLWILNSFKTIPLLMIISAAFWFWFAVIATSYRFWVLPITSIPKQRLLNLRCYFLSFYHPIVNGISVVHCI